MRTAFGEDRAGFGITAKACLSELTLSTRGAPMDLGLRRSFSSDELLA